MKPYFAKYLPVEGEIRIGKAIDGGIYSRPNIVDIIVVEDLDKDYGYAKNSNGGIYNINGIRKLTPVKLFLCSRDIQVGDKVLCPMPYKNNKLEEFVIVERPENYHLDMLVGKFSDGREMKEPAYLNQMAFKVIGEISPDAIFYVKEGDEFDEDQISIVYKIRGSISDKLEVLFVKIKGPCGHFH